MQRRLHEDPALITIAAPRVAYCCVQYVTQSHVRCRILKLKAGPRPQLEDEMCSELKLGLLSG